MNIKYNYPHTFFLSTGVILLIFGFYPFYIYNFNFHMLTLTKIVIHLLSLLIAGYFIFVGFSLWDERERERDETALITKKRILQEIELKELDIQERKAQQSISQLNKEIDSLRKSKDKTKKDIEKEIGQKTEDLEKLKEESLKKQKEIEEKSKEISKLKREEISKMPSNYLWTNRLFSASGASVLSPKVLDSYPKYTYAQTEGNYSYTSKNCRNCGKIFVGFGDLCRNCS